MSSINPCFRTSQRKTKIIKKQKKEGLRCRNNIQRARNVQIPNIFKRKSFGQLFQQTFMTQQIKTKIQNLKYLTQYNIKQLNFTQFSVTFSKAILNMQFAIKRQQKQIQKILSPQTYHESQDQSNCINSQDEQEQQDQKIIRDLELKEVSLNLQEKQLKNGFEDCFNWKSLCPTVQHYQFRSEDNLGATNVEKTELDTFQFN